MLQKAILDDNSYQWYQLQVDSTTEYPFASRNGPLCLSISLVILYNELLQYKVPICVSGRWKLGIMPDMSFS